MLDKHVKKHYFIMFSLLFFATLILLIGGSLYLLYRPHNLKMFYWLRAIKLEKFFYQHNFNSTSKLISFCIYSLPNGLWLLSAIVFLGLIWKKEKDIFFFYSFSFLLVSLLFECLQLTQIIPGTFDFNDIFILVISFLFGVILYKQIIARNVR